MIGRIFLLSVFLTIFHCAPPEPGMRIILVGPFKNAGPERYDYLGHGFASRLISDLRLAADKRTEVLGRTVLRFAFKEKGMPLEEQTSAERLATAARIVGANFFCTGRYTVHEGRVEIFVRLFRVNDPGDPEKEFRVSGNLGNLSGLLDRISIELLKKEFNLFHPLAMLWPARFE